MIGNVRDRIGYLHIPKTAGSSATEAIQRAVRATVDADGRPPSMCPKPYDRTLFGNFDLDELPEHQQSQIFTGTPEDMATFDVVIGHYSVQMLRSGRELDDLVVLFREPRSRLLSLYTFWRSWSAEQHAGWGQYGASRHAADQNWPEFLEDAAIASQTDNIAARLILGQHRLIPPDSFIDDSAVEELTHEALALIAQFGHVDVIENGDDCWQRLGEWANLDLDIGRRNPTPLDRGPVPDWSRITDGDVLRSLDSRTRIDQQLWLAAAALHSEARDADWLVNRADSIAQAQADKMIDRATAITAPSRTGRVVAAWQQVFRRRPGR